MRIPTIKTSSHTLDNYRLRSLSLLENGFVELRNGRWSRSEEMIWGSLVLAVKGAALSKGHTLTDNDAIREYSYNLGREYSDRQIRDSFKSLDGFPDMVEKVMESGLRLDYIFMLLDDVAGAIERLWDSIATENPN